MTNDHYISQSQVQNVLKIIKHCLVPMPLTHLAHVFIITLSLTKTLLDKKIFVFSYTIADIFI